MGAGGSCSASSATFASGWATGARTMQVAGVSWPSQKQTADGRTFWLTGTVPEATVKLFRGEALPRARARQRRSRSPPLQIEFARDSVSRASSSAVASLPAGLLRGRRGPGEEAHGRWYWGGVWPVWAGSVGGVWDRLGRFRMPPKATATVTSIASTRRGSRQSYSNSHNGRNGSRYSRDSHPPQPQPQQTNCHSRQQQSRPPQLSDGHGGLGG